MAYDDGFYYGQCKLVFELGSKTGTEIKVYDSNNVSRVVDMNTRTITVPGRDEYRAVLNNAGTEVFSTKVQCGYGDCIKIVLDEGYEPVVQKDFIELKDNLTAEKDGAKVPFEFAYDATTNRFGYKVGADPVIPFLSSMKRLNSSGASATADKDYLYGMAVCMFVAGGGTSTYNLTHEVTLKHGSTTTKQTPITGSVVTIKQPGITYVYELYEFKDGLKKDDVIARNGSWSPTPTSGKSGGRLDVFVID